jgi:hypothetical protein
VGEGAPGRLVVHRGRLALEPGELPLDVSDEQVGEVVGEAAADDDTERGPPPEPAPA